MVGENKVENGTTIISKCIFKINRDKRFPYRLMIDFKR